MAHAPVDEAPIPDGYSVSDEFFIYKFSKEQAGLSGLAFDEGVFGVFGYVTEVRFGSHPRPAACHGGGAPVKARPSLLSVVCNAVLSDATGYAHHVCMYTCMARCHLDSQVRMG